MGGGVGKEARKMCTKHTSLAIFICEATYGVQPYLPEKQCHDGFPEGKRPGRICLPTSYRGRGCGQHHTYGYGIYQNRHKGRHPRKAVQDPHTNSRP